MVYEVKQSGVKIRMKESLSFYCRFPGKAPISALCLDHYVTNERPIICLGSQMGDIAIYYVDHVSQQGKLGPKLILQFNFFERGPSKVLRDGSDEEGGADEEDSLLDR